MKSRLEGLNRKGLLSNQYSDEYMEFLEHIITPILRCTIIRVWHYTRLLDFEAVRMQQQLTPSTLGGLALRLDQLVDSCVINQDEADTILQQSIFHTQEELRSNCLWVTTVPWPAYYHGVVPLLESWGGEIAYFGLSKQILQQKLKKIGLPRIIEIEVGLKDRMNAYSVSRTVVEAWARRRGFGVRITGSDMCIRSCLQQAQVLKIHTEGDDIFRKVGVNYPGKFSELTGWDD